jgi:hypothetical protein
MDTSNYTLIEKEEVSTLHFPKEEVLEDTDLIKLRKAAVNRAISLGNLEHYKVKIFFADDQGEKMVNTTIWAVTDISIVLKQNVQIPINRITKLEI